MPDHKTTGLTADKMLARWEENKYLTAAERQRVGDFIAARAGSEELPIPMRIMSALGAMMASLAVGCFLGLTKIVDFHSTLSMLFWGAMFIANAVVVNKAAAQAGMTKGSFLAQISFCSMGIGKLMVVCGSVHPFDHSNPWDAPIALGVLTAVVWPFYRVSIDRFVSSALVLLLVLFNIQNDYDLIGMRENLMDIFFLAQMGIAGLLLTHPRVTRDFAPLSSALVLSLCVTVACCAAPHHTFDPLQYMAHPAVVNLGLTAALIVLIAWAAGTTRNLTKEPLLAAVAGSALLGCLSAPGILLSICLMILGYARSDKHLVSGGAVLMPVFLFLYYYNLDLTLMAKAGVLVCSGLVLLSGCLYMHARQIAKEILP